MSGDQQHPLLWQPSLAMPEYPVGQHVSLLATEGAKEQITHTFATGPTTVFPGTQNTASTCADAHSESGSCQQKRTHRRDEVLTVSKLHDGHDNYF